MSFPRKRESRLQSSVDSRFRGNDNCVASFVVSVCSLHFVLCSGNTYESSPKWLAFAPIGLTLIGLGLSITMDANARKGRGESWFWRGTLGLCIVNSGVSVFGDAVKARVLHDISK